MYKLLKYTLSRALGYKTFVMLNSPEHEVLNFINIINLIFEANFLLISVGNVRCSSNKF